MESSTLPVCMDLLKLMRGVKVRMSDVAEKYGMTGIQLGALYKISENQVSMGKVAQMLHCDASNATGIVDRLVALDLVTRQECAQDRRSKILAVTPHGASIIHEVKADLPELLGCSQFSEVECRAVHSLATKLSVDPT